MSRLKAQGTAHSAEGWQGVFPASRLRCQNVLMLDLSPGCTIPMRAEEDPGSKDQIVCVVIGMVKEPCFGSTALLVRAPGPFACDPV